MKPLLSLVLLAAIFGAGCAPQEEAAPASDMPAFEGTPDEKFVGKWTNNKNKSFYDLKKDGSFRFEGTVSSPGGTFENKFDGEWAVTKDNILLFKDASNNVSDYTAKLEGNKLTLISVGTMKTETVLTKS